MERNPGKRTDLTSQPRDARLKGLLKSIGLDETVARKAQRIGCMPDEEMARAFEQAKAEARLLHYNELLILARPWWYKENWKARHRAIHAGAVGKMVLEHPGPFPLIYARHAMQWWRGGKRRCTSVRASPLPRDGLCPD